MVLTIFILCLLHLILASPVQQEYDVEDIEQLRYQFNAFKIKYNKSYTAEEERFHYFKESVARINELNKRNSLTVYGINHFSDWSAMEKQNLLGFGGANLGDDGYGSCSVGVASDIKTGSVSDAIDWRDRNAVAPVQNQGTCGSCWAFGAASVLEGAYAIKHNTLLKVSEQQFVDCDTESSGCNGGFPHYAISSTMQLGGQELQNDYSYTGQQQECQYDVNKATVKASSCKVYPDIGDSDDKLANLLASTGPLSIVLDGNTTLFYDYHEGIFDDCAANNLNHAVSLIGYGEENGTPYWIIKNSWGVQWGEAGFARVKRGVGCLLIGGYALTADVA